MRVCFMPDANLKAMKQAAENFLRSAPVSSQFRTAADIIDKINDADNRTTGREMDCHSKHRVRRGHLENINRLAIDLRTAYRNWHMAGGDNFLVSDLDILVLNTDPSFLDLIEEKTHAK